jgi:septum formation protein
MSAQNKLILASNSPRRQELLKNAGFQFDVFTRNIDESIPEKTPIELVAKIISELKNKAYRELLNDEIILTSDTIVVSNDMVLGKPENKKEAAEMLQKLSGKAHDVISGVCISSMQRAIVFDDVTRVFFKELSLEQINHYIDEYQPFDKAGAYGIQEWIGMIGVEKIIGSYYNVMGLPIHKVYDNLKQEFNILPH